MLQNKGNLIVIVFMFVIAGGVAAIMISNSDSDNQNNNTSSQQNVTSNSDTGSVQGTNDGFVGNTGKTIKAQSNKIFISESDVSDGNIHYFNYYSEQAGKNIYFFVIKASDETYRAAANACEVCFEAKKGFTQQGNNIRCDNCGVTYSKDQIAKEKGGCNPGPIDANTKVVNGNLEINTSDVEAIAFLF